MKLKETRIPYLPRKRPIASAKYQRRYIDLIL